jgi:hypothetical protein
MSAHSEALAIIESLLPDDGEWHPAAVVYAAALQQNISETTMWRAARALGIEHERLRQPRSPVMWRLPPLVETEAPLRSVDIRNRDAA